MRGFAVPACATLIALMVVAQLLICSGMQDSVRNARYKIGAPLQPILDRYDVNDPEWRRASEVSRELMGIDKAVYNLSSLLFYAQLLLGVGAIGVLLVHKRKGCPRAVPDNPRMQTDAAVNGDGGDEDK